MSRKGALLVGAAVLTVLAALWVTAASPVHIVQSSTEAPPTSGVPSDVTVEPPRDLTETTNPDNAVVDVAISVLLALLILPLLIMVLLARTRQRTSRSRAATPRRRSPRFDIPEPMDDAPEALSATTRDQLAALTEGDPRNAIVACWLALEETAISVGFRRDPAETSTEFTTRVLAFHSVDRAAITDLAELYREARFSEHELGEGHRRAAIAAVTRLHAELSRLARDPVGHAAP